MSLHMIWAQDGNGLIGQDGSMPWHLPEDMAHFKRTTAGHPVVMGRTTWESLPPRSRPLPGRENLVLSRRPAFTAQGARVLADLREVLDLSQTEEIWCIGGAELYRSLLPQASELVVTVIQEAFEGDAFAPGTDGFQRVAREPEAGWFTSRVGLHYRFETYRRPQ